jgi:1-phosphofructokinase
MGLDSMHSFDAVTITLNPAIDTTLVIPHFAAGQVNRVTRTYHQAGGKGVNVAATLAGHGFKTAVTGFLGRDNEDLFQAFFAQRGLGNFFLPVPGKTREGLKIVDPEQHRTTDVNFPGFTLGPDDFGALVARVGELTACPWFVMSGSLPPSVPVWAYRDLIRRVKAAGCRVVLDTSGEAFGAALEAVPQVIKPNRHELAAFLGRPLSDRDSVCREARGLLDRGIEMVVVSMDEDGALFITRDEALCVRPPRVKVNSTVGAGDAMVAGIVAAQLRGLTLSESARLATSFSLDLLTRQPEECASAARTASWMEQVELEML